MSFLHLRIDLAKQLRLKSSLSTKTHSILAKCSPKPEVLPYLRLILIDGVDFEVAAPKDSGNNEQ